MPILPRRRIKRRQCADLLLYSNVGLEVDHGFQRVRDQAVAFGFLERPTSAIRIDAFGNRETRPQIDVRELRDPIDAIESAAPLATQ
jgi:hypothetical protein